MINEFGIPVPHRTQRTHQLRGSTRGTKRLCFVCPDVIVQVCLHYPLPFLSVLNEMTSFKDGAELIAQHFGFALNWVFEVSHHPALFFGGGGVWIWILWHICSGWFQTASAPGVIIVEDDLLFSPDFMEYFEGNVYFSHCWSLSACIHESLHCEAVAPALDKDSTLFVASAWNDNGFHGKVCRSLYWIFFGIRRAIGASSYVYSNETYIIFNNNMSCITW